MKKLAHEKELLKKALEVGESYAKNRGYSQFSQTTGAKQKVEALYRLLVQDNLIQALAKGQDSDQQMRHKLAIWISKQLPEGHELLKP